VLYFHMKLKWWYKLDGRLDFDAVAFEIHSTLSNSDFGHVQLPQNFPSVAPPEVRPPKLAV
jgi:hypothetical protein